MAGLVIKGETEAGVPATSEMAGADPIVPRIAALDGFRALAILFVLFYHYTVRWAPPQDPAPHLPAGQMFQGFAPAEFGWFGVEFFFAISGFVILMTLERCRNIADFALRRFARLWPAMAVSAALTALVMALAGPADWQVGGYDYLTSVFFLSPNITSALLHGTAVKWADGAYWSLWVEVRFYALAAIVYLAAGRNFIKAWLAFFVAALALHHLAAYSGSAGMTRAVDLVSFPKYLPYFALGICAYALHSGGPRRWAAAGAVLAAAPILYDAVFAREIFEGASPAIGTFLVLTLFALLLLFLTDSPWLALFRSAPMVMLGQASYSLYLIHQYIGVALIRRGVDLGLPYLVVFPLVSLGIAGLALLMFRIIEVPAKAWILRRSQNIVAGADQCAPLLSFRPAR